MTSCSTKWFGVPSKAPVLRCPHPSAPRSSAASEMETTNHPLGNTELDVVEAAWRRRPPISKTVFTSDARSFRSQ